MSFATVLKRAAARKAFYQSAAWKTMLQQYPQLEGLENVTNTSGQYAWVKHSVLTDQRKDIWQQLSSGTADVNTALSQLQRIGDQVLASS